MRSLITSLILMCVFTSCSSIDSTEVLSPVADSVMVEVFIELHLAEARTDLFQETEISYRDSILAKYSMSTSDFNEVMTFYKEHPAAYHKVYSKALNQLSEERFMPDKPHTAIRPD